MKWACGEDRLLLCKEHPFQVWGCLLCGIYVPYIYRMPGGVIIGDSGLCCCGPEFNVGRQLFERNYFPLFVDPFQVLHPWFRQTGIGQVSVNASVMSRAECYTENRIWWSELIGQSTGIQIRISIPPNQLLCRLVCARLLYVCTLQHAPKLVHTLNILYLSVVKE